MPLLTAREPPHRLAPTSSTLYKKKMRTETTHDFLKGKSSDFNIM
jgi:hypothetical protein